ncbi:MAG: phage replisome organizer N-terminal domain-containing protein [Clostridia bacterium]
MDKEEVKGRYFYLMLKENFFDTDDMVILESMENGYLYSNILLKLYLKSLKDKGKLMYKDRIPYSVEMIAKLTRHNKDVVRVAIEIFINMGIIEKLDNGAIFMLDIENYIGKSSTEADRRRKLDRRIATEKALLIPLEKSPEKSHEHTDLDLEEEDDILNNICSRIGIFKTTGLNEFAQNQLKLFENVIAELNKNNVIDVLNNITLDNLTLAYEKMKGKNVGNEVSYMTTMLINDFYKKR